MRQWLYLAAAFSLVADMAAADVLRTQVRTTPVVVGDDEPCATPVFVPLNDAGRTNAAFNVPGPNRRVVVTYNAVCFVAAPGFGTYVNIQILIDGEPVPPANNIDTALCTSNDFESLPLRGGAMNTAMATRNVRPGTHRVQVRAQLRGCSDPRDDRYRLNSAVLTVLQ